MTKPNLTAIVAMAKNRVIGGDNQLLWHLSEDLKRFKQLTTGQQIIMGRLTYESLPIRPLPNRKHIILSRDTEFKVPECQVVGSVSEALKSLDANLQPFVIGGAEIYELFLPYCTQILLTEIHKKYEGDAYFPRFEDEFQETKRDDFLDAPLPYSFVTYTRK